MNKRKLQKQMMRHGECLLVPVDSVPDSYEESFNGKEYVVAHSESGHHHVLVGRENALTVFTPKGADSADIYVRVNSPGTQLEHLKTFDRHETQEVYEGLYLVRPKNEFDYFENLTRRVVD